MHSSRGLWVQTPQKIMYGYKAWNCRNVRQDSMQKPPRNHKPPQNFLAMPMHSSFDAQPVAQIQNMLYPSLAAG